MDGHDAFGISKSFSPKTGYKAITAMSRAERAAIRQPAKGATDADKGFKAKMISTQRALEVQKPKLEKGPGAGHAGTIRVGGAKNGKSYIMGSGEGKTYKLFRDHEGAHARINRSSYRAHSQIQGNPIKQMREEARADFEAGGHYKKHGTKGSGYAGMARTADKAEKKVKPYNIPGRIGRANAKAKSSMQRANWAAKFPHYGGAAKDPKTLTAYRDLHDSMKAKGIKGGKSRGEGPTQKQVDRRNRNIAIGVGGVTTAGGAGVGYMAYKNKKS